MKLKKCDKNHYTLKKVCPFCMQTAKEAHYKFVKLKKTAKL